MEKVSVSKITLESIKLLYLKGYRGIRQSSYQGYFIEKCYYNRSENCFYILIWELRFSDKINKYKNEFLEGKEYKYQGIEYRYLNTIIYNSNNYDLFLSKSLILEDFIKECQEINLIEGIIL